MGLGGVAIATLPSVIFPKLMFSDRLGGGCFLKGGIPFVNLAPSYFHTRGNKKCLGGVTVYAQTVTL